MSAVEVALSTLPRHPEKAPSPDKMADTDAYGRSGSGWAERDKDEEDIAAQREWSATKDATVFLIDCSPSMALPVQTTRSEDDTSPSQPPSRGIDLALLLVETALRNACVLCV
jgi:hypothetical protein